MVVLGSKLFKVMDMDRPDLRRSRAHGRNVETNEATSDRRRRLHQDYNNQLGCIIKYGWQR